MYTVTYHDPLTNDYHTEEYITKELRNARIEMLVIMGYAITGTNSPKE